MVPAEPSQVGAVSDLLDGAAAWLHARGLDQWPDPFAAERLMEAIDRGATYLVVDRGRAVATVTLDVIPDQEFWSPRECREPALYVRKLAIDRAYRGLGSRLLNWAGTQAYDRKLGLLRLDAWKTNEGLRDYYIGQGFEFVGKIDLAHRNSGALFQRAAYPKPSSLVLASSDQVWLEPSVSVSSGVLVGR